MDFFSVSNLKFQLLFCKFVTFRVCADEVENISKSCPGAEGPSPRQSPPLRKGLSAIFIRLSGDPTSNSDLVSHSVVTWVRR